jgi:hypothetical protein
MPTRFGVALVSGLKAFAISGLSAVGVLLATGGIDASSKEKIVVAVIIAFLSGGIKSLEKAYNFKPSA